MLILKSSNSPLTGGNRTRIIAFFAFFPLSIFLVAVIVDILYKTNYKNTIALIALGLGGVIATILIVIFGLYIMKKDQSFTPIINAKKWIKVCLVVMALGITTLVTVVYYNEKEYDSVLVGPNWYNKQEVYNENIKIETAMVAGAGLVATPIAVGFFMLIFNSLFFRPLEEHQNWIIKNGVFSDEKSSKNDSTNIVGRDNLSSYSVADEMLKWNALLEKGLITKEEFDKAKSKLMNGEKA